MPLDQQESAQLNYKAQIRYYQKRVADLQANFVNTAVAAQTDVDPDTYISNLNDLGFKASSLAQRIDSASTGLTIPINPATEPAVSAAVMAIDPGSNGLYVSYATYMSALGQINAGIANLNVETLIANASSDPTSNSQLVQSSIYGGYASFAGNPTAASSTYADIIQTWGETDSNLQQVVSFANNYLNTFPDPAYVPWAFAPDVASETTQIGNLTNLWNGFSATGTQNISSLGGTLQNATPLSVDPNITALTNNYLSYTNAAFNGINNLLNNVNSFANSVCLTSLLISLNLNDLVALVKDLEGLTVAFQLLKTSVSFDFNDLLSSFESVLANTMRNIILNQLLNIMVQMSQRIFSPINAWILNQEKGIAPFLVQCPPAQKFINYINGSVGLVEQQVNDIIIEFMKNLELKKIQSSAKLSLATTMSEVSQILSIIGQLKQIVASAQSSASNVNLQASISNQFSGQSVPTAYIYPLATSPNTYNSFPDAVPAVAPMCNISPAPGPIQWTN